MKKKIIIITILLVISACVGILGFGIFCVASMPFQDIQQVPESALIKQEKDILTGEIMLIIGAVVFLGTIIGGTIAIVLEKLKTKGEKNSR